MHKMLAHDNSWILIICAFSYTYTASTTRCNSYNSEVFKLFISIEEHFWRFSFYFQMSWYHYFLMSPKNRRKPSSGFEFEIISVIIYWWFIILLTPPAACYIAPKVCFVEPFVISPKSSKETCKWCVCDYDYSVSAEAWFRFSNRRKLLISLKHS